MKTQTPHQQLSLPPRNNVLGVNVSVLNLDSAEHYIFEALEKRRKGYVCVTGVHGVSESQEDEDLRRIHNDAFLVTTDGMPLVWLNRWAGHRAAGRVYGPDLMLRILEKSCETGHTHFLYGGAQGVAEDLKRRLEERMPGLKIVGTYTPPFRPLTEEEEGELQRRVKDVRPDIIWVGLSTPKQERFMAQYLDKLNTTLMFGVGAAFDFHSGRVRQAPGWMQKSGLEWFFRLYTEPKRLWKRYLRNNPLFIYRIILQKSGIRKYESPSENA